MLLEMGMGITGDCGTSTMGCTLSDRVGVREGFLEVTIPALRPEGEKPAAKPGLESSRYDRLAREGCQAVWDS